MASVLESGWFDDFKEQLKYITLQHYPQNNCGPTHAYELDYYLHHANVVTLAQWQENGLNVIRQQPASSRKPILMDEFSSASCGGLPGISDTFGAAMWSVDYGLRLASVGYSGAYLHTRERGVTYNLFDPPAGPAAGAGAWNTNPTFYAYLPISEALQGTNGSKVVDLNVQNSSTDTSQSVAGYAIYDAVSNEVHHLALFNFANATGGPVDFALPASIVSSSPSGNVAVRYLTAPNVNDKINIAWGNQTWAGMGDGTSTTAVGSWVQNDQAAVPCSQGCTVSVPGPSVAVVYVGGFDPLPSTNSSSSSSSAPSDPSKTGAPDTNNQQVNNAVFGVHATGMTALLVVVATTFAFLL